LIFLAVLASAGAMVLVALFSGVPTRVPAKAALHVKIEAPFSEIEPADVLSQLLRTAPTLRQTLHTIRRAKEDSRVTTLVVRPVSGGVLWAQVQEVRAAIVDFKTSGKPVVAYLESAGASEYYLASAADKVVLMPAGELDLTGVASYELFFRGALEKLGVLPDLLHIGDFKTASNTFTERGFTPAHREMTASLNRDWYDELVRGVAEGRKLEPAAASALIGGGPYLAKDALAHKLVDVLGYEDQLDDDAPLRETEPIEFADYERATPSATAASTGRIALLYAVGMIASGESRFDSPTGSVVGSDTFAQWVRKVRVDPSIAAVVVRIDSPGGSAIASEVMWRELKLTRDVKPVIVSMGDVAASGGYYIAAPAHVIVAQPGTLTGSIGVVTGKFVLKGTMDKLGIGTDTVTDGRSADLYSPFRPFSPEERGRLEDQMQAVYDLFVSRVAEGRAQPTTAIDAVAQGRVWTGRQARERGLLDELGGLDRAIEIAKERAKLDPKQRVELVIYPQKQSVYELLSSRFGTSSARLDALVGGPEARAIESAASIIRLFRRGEPLAILPNVFVR
jgi:protease-4